MTITITLLLLLSAFIATIVHALGKCPLWIPVLLLVIAMLLGSLPVR
jgi:hypothetical protein